jgi:predicted DNA-binding transcriptional regulator YafY
VAGQVEMVDPADEVAVALASELQAQFRMNHGPSVERHVDSFGPISSEAVDLSKGRLLTLLELLQVHRSLSGAEIARRLEISPRTVRRYMTGLQEMGIPVEAERGRAGGYHMRAGFRLPPLMFTNDEALVLVLGLLAAQRLGLTPQGPAVQGALAKLDRVLPASLRDRLRAAQETLDLGLAPVAQGRADSETVLTLSSAARDGTRLSVRYRSARGEETERLVDPYGVAFQSGQWYLVAWDHLRADLRTFRLDRLLTVETTRVTFERPVAFDLMAHMQRSLATVPYPWMATVRLRASLEEARRRVHPTVGTLQGEDGAVLQRMGSDDLEWIARRLAGLGMDFSIVGPEELRQAVRREAARLAGCAAG